MTLILTHFWDTIFPPKCVFCKKPHKNLLCEFHEQTLDLVPNIFKSQKELTLYSIANYQNAAVKRLVFLYKFWGIYKISDILAKRLLESFTKEIPKGSILIPIPLHWSRKVWRGYNQANKIAKSLQKLRPDLIINNNLKRIKKTKQQASLNKLEREKNMEGVFFLKNANTLQNKNIFLIDDVFTSGSTIHAAQSELQTHGILSIKAICFARTQKK